jgi:hypothetical protein
MAVFSHLKTINVHVFECLGFSLHPSPFSLFFNHSEGLVVAGVLHLSSYLYHVVFV